MPLCFDTSAAEYKIGPFYVPIRFFALFAFCVMALTNGFAWFEFDPIVSQTKARFPSHVDSTTIELLSSWQPILFLILFVPMTIIITKQDGLRRAMRIGSTCALMGGCIKIIGSVVFKESAVGVGFLHVGQILVAVGAPSVIGGVSALAAHFFPPNERARATAAAILCNDLGGAVGYVLSPTLSKSSLGITAVLFFEMGLVVLLSILVWFVFPDAPKRRAVLEAQPEDAIALEHHHFETDANGNTLNNFNGGSSPNSGSSPTGGGVLTNLANSDFTSHITFKAQLEQLLTKSTPIMVMLIFSWCSGGFVAWTSMFDMMLEEKYDSALIGTISFVTSLSYVVGGLVAGYLVDKYYHHHMASFISIALSIACIGTTAFTAVVPTEPSEDAVLELGSPILIFITAAISGAGYGAATPVFFELLADFSYPVDEAISGGLLSMMEAVGALVIYQLVARFLEGGSMNYAFAGGCALCLVLSTFLDEQHNRPATEEEEEGEGMIMDDGDEDSSSARSPTVRKVPLIATGGTGRRTNANADVGAEELVEVAPAAGSTALSQERSDADEEARKKKRALLIAKKKKELILAKRAALAAVGRGDGDDSTYLEDGDEEPSASTTTSQQQQGHRRKARNAVDEDRVGLTSHAVAYEDE